MRNLLRRVYMSKFVRGVVLLILCGIAMSPLMIGPEMAESYGYDRVTGSNIGVLISMVACALMSWVSLTIIRRRARRQAEHEVNRLLAKYPNESDKGKP